MKPAKGKRKPERRTLWFTVRKALLIDHTTGEVLKEPVGVLAPRDGLQRRYMRQRKYHVGTELKGDVHKGRNYAQWKTMHGLGLMCMEQIERFAEFTDAHAVVKCLQRESGTACTVVQMDAGPVIEAVLAASGSVLGTPAAKALRELLPLIKTIDVTEAESLSYENMDQGFFDEVFKALCTHVLRTYWQELDEDEGRAKIMNWIGENAQ